MHPGLDLLAILHKIIEKKLHQLKSWELIALESQIRARVRERGQTSGGLGKAYSAQKLISLSSRHPLHQKLTEELLIRARSPLK